MPLIARIRARLASQAGFTVVPVLGVLTAAMAVGVAAFAASGGDLHLSRNDQDQKRAYAAAEAGVADYFFHLTQNNGYWAQCTEPGGALNDPGPNALDRTRQVPGSDARYAIELLPANGAARCDPANAHPTMIVAEGRFANTFSIRSTGISRGVHRSIVATFRRRGFLDYLYYTDLEVADPVWYVLATRGAPTRSGPGDGTWPPNSDLLTWASQNCTGYWRDGRGDQRYPKAPNTVWQRQVSGRWITQSGSVECMEIRFAAGDALDGPVHSNDEFLICGAPVFGRDNENDPIEVSGGGWRPDCNGASPVLRGEWKPNSPLLTPPPSNNSLKSSADTRYVFEGTTTIVLEGTRMRVTNAKRRLRDASMALPTNGLIYVDSYDAASGGCPVPAYEPLDPYGDPVGCANVYVRGTYSRDLTIASAKDLIVNGNTQRSGDRMLGLIANNFVRVFHSVRDRNPSDVTDCNNDVGLQNLIIDAAILALQHSFTVDNYYCGTPLGTLRVNGAIAQKYRGPVGRGSSTNAVNGYLKKYVYDERLRLREPPHFLDPVQATWRIQRYVEQVPAR